MALQQMAVRVVLVHLALLVVLLLFMLVVEVVALTAAQGELVETVEVELEHLLQAHLVLQQPIQVEVVARLVVTQVLITLAQRVDQGL